MFIRSERLFLRPGWPEDTEELLALIDDAEAVRNLSGKPWPFAADTAPRPGRRPLPRYCVTLPSAEGTRLIGSIGLSRAAEDVELSCWIARAFWRQGYGTEAARAILAQAHALGLRRIVAYRFVDDPASDHMLVKAGFTSTGSVQPRYCAARGGFEPAENYMAELGHCGSQDDGAAIRAA